MDYYAAFLLGLVGSLHCAGMCGPLMLALPRTGGNTVGFVSGRLAYNCGRVFTYCLLGVVFGSFGQALALAGIQRWVCITLGIVLLLGLFASRKLALWSPLPAFVNRLKSRMAALLKRRSLASMTVLGLLNGLLPCGLVYVAGAGATVTGGLFSGIIYMSVFGLGTMPMMLALGVYGKFLPVSLRLKLAKAIPASVFLLAVLLVLRGMSLGIPYISPDLSAASCCHR